MKLVHIYKASYRTDIAFHCLFQEPQRRKDLEYVMDVVKSIGSNILSVSNEFGIKLKDMKGR